MATIDDYMELVQESAKKFNLSVAKIQDHVISLYVESTGRELARIIYFESEQGVGVAFQTEVAPSDAITFFSFCRSFLEGVHLHECYYVTVDENVYHGIYAVDACEEEREAKYLKILQEKQRAQQEEDFQTKQLEKAGKLTFH